MSDSKQNNPWIETAQVLGVSAVLALTIRAFIAQVFYIPSRSMEPTLEVNDRLIVEKVSYYFRSPERAEIVVFRAPEAAISGCGLPPDSRDAFIKRVVAIPGDRIEVQGGQVFVNDEVVEEPFITESPRYRLGPEVVPEDSYLVLGDNRNDSCDGHVWGFLPEEDIIGRAAFRFWPPSQFGSIN